MVQYARVTMEHNLYIYRHAALVFSCCRSVDTLFDMNGKSAHEGGHPNSKAVEEVIASLATSEQANGTVAGHSHASKLNLGH